MGKFSRTWGLVCGMGLVVGAASASERPAVPAAPTVASVQACMRDNLVDKAALRDLGLSRIDVGGKTHALRMKLYWKPAAGGVRVNMRLLEPMAIRGSSYLLLQQGRGEEVFFFLPGADRALRITGENMDEPLWGTDLSYGEIKQVLGLAAEGTTALAAPDQLAGRRVHTLITEPRNELGGYRRIVSLVDAASCTLLRSDFFGKAEAPRKRLEADLTTLLEADGRWLVLGYTMHDLQRGSSTQITLSDFSIDERLPEYLFDPKRFHQAAP